ncbi:4Fe-4S dicluster domain-containing protein [Vallitalea okinawensis]|uniref:4Fe-4S dicluster domain-containing protein n=1 Tax=Vallitalea okinawensis TaxID=2078660 RepID=UPI000CFADA7A|nr:4Fe-4S dicluster domain-containing protein [Vallitalea okinawensis]
MEDKEKPRYKWDNKNLSVKCRPPNNGKEITDNNPYIDIDIEQLDHYSEIKPLDQVPDIMKKNRRGLVKLEIYKMINVTGSPFNYLPLVVLSIAKMRIQLKTSYPRIAKDKEKNLVLLKEQIREFAKSRGYICGFTKIDRRYISEANDDLIPYDTVIVLGMEMDKDLTMEIPYPGKNSKKLFDFEIYEKSGQEVFKVANFIRTKGYKCFARVPADGAIKYPPHAVNAGLGNYGTNGLVITKEFGSRVRWTMICMDADIEPDQPRNLHIEEFCSRCRLCQKSCLGQAIPKEASYWRGAMKRRVNDKKCWPQFVKYDGCGVCLKVCPFNNQGYDACIKSLQPYYQYDVNQQKVIKQ